MTLFITNANVVDVRTGTTEKANLWCADGRIQGIGLDPPPATAAGPRLDAGGAFVVPGFIDAHVHVAAVDVDLGVNERMAPSLVTALAARTMREMLHRGFTSVRDMGGADLGLAQAQRRGLFTGPRLVYAGRRRRRPGAAPGEGRRPPPRSRPATTAAAAGSTAWLRFARPPGTRSAKGPATSS